MQKKLTDVDIEDAIQDVVDTFYMGPGIGYEEGEKSPLDVAEAVLERLGFVYEE